MQPTGDLCFADASTVEFLHLVSMECRCHRPAQALAVRAGPALPALPPAPEPAPASAYHRCAAPPLAPPHGSTPPSPAGSAPRLRPPLPIRQGFNHRLELCIVLLPQRLPHLRQHGLQFLLAHFHPRRTVGLWGTMGFGWADNVRGRLVGPVVIRTTSHALVVGWCSLNRGRRGAASGCAHSRRPLFQPELSAQQLNLRRRCDADRLVGDDPHLRVGNPANILTAKGWSTVNEARMAGSGQATYRKRCIRAAMARR